VVRDEKVREWRRSGVGEVARAGYEEGNTVALAMGVELVIPEWGNRKVRVRGQILPA